MAVRRVAAQEWTYQDYRRIPADGRRYEVHEGELWMAPSPTTRHQRIAFRLGRELARRAEDHDLGEVFVAPLDVVLAPNTVVQPDVVFVRRERMDIVTEENIQGVPDLVVEVLSPGTRALDRNRKRLIYQRAGVPEYWVVDGERREVAVHTLELTRKRYGQPTLCQGESLLRSQAIPGLELSLGRLWT